MRDTGGPKKVGREAKGSKWRTRKPASSHLKTPIIHHSHCLKKKKKI